MWLSKYPDGGNLKDPKPKFNIKNDPLRPQGLGVQVQDNLRPIPKYNPVEEQNKVELLKMKSQPQLKAGKTKNLYEQKVDQAKKEAYVAANPNAQLVNGNITVKNAAYNLENQPFGPGEKRDEVKAGHMVGALEAASYVTGAGELYGAVKPFVKAGLKQAGKYLTEQTALKNAYKLNPYAFQPSENMMYRGIGEAGAADALESGVFRAKQNVEPLLYNGVDMSKQFKGTYYSPNFATADQYGAGYIAEVPKDAAAFRNRYSKGKNWSQIADENIPIEKGRILKKDWLQGYKEIPKPTSSQEVISISSGMDAIYAKQPGYNSHLFNKQGYVPPTTDPNLMVYKSGYNPLSEDAIEEIKHITQRKKPSFVNQLISEGLSPASIAAVELGRRALAYGRQYADAEGKARVDGMLQFVPGLKENSHSILNQKLVK